MLAGIVALVVVLASASVFAMTRPRYIEATGIGLAPKGMRDAQAKALARRGAIVDLQRNLVTIIGNGDPNGSIRGVEVFQDEWDGTSYKVSGRIRVNRQGIPQ
jgi:hypothetical protein